jgi:hypothetical protein
VKEKITLHHMDRDRSNNTPANRQLMHSECHKAYHVALRRDTLRRKQTALQLEEESNRED